MKAIESSIKDRICKFVEHSLAARRAKVILLSVSSALGSNCPLPYPMPDKRSFILNGIVIFH